MVTGSALISLLVWIIVIGLVFYLLFWLIGYVGLPAPFDKVACVILAVAAVIFLISVLLEMVGKPLIRW